VKCAVVWSHLVEWTYSEGREEREREREWCGGGGELARAKAFTRNGILEAVNQKRKHLPESACISIQTFSISSRRRVNQWLDMYKVPGIIVCVRYSNWVSRLQNHIFTFGRCEANKTTLSIHVCSMGPKTPLNSNRAHANPSKPITTQVRSI